MLWLALHLPAPQTPTRNNARLSSAEFVTQLATQQEAWEAQRLNSLACWAGRFTPHVNLAEATLRLEISASLRLFGGLESLLQLLRADLARLELAVRPVVAATPLAALWLARADGFTESATVCPDLPTTHAALATLPLTALNLPPVLARRITGFGLHRLGQVLALPRASLGERLGKAFVVDLARALGEIPDPQRWFVFPECFEQSLELTAPVENAAVLMFAARRLIAALAGWLAVRNAAVREIEVIIEHEAGATTPVTTVPLAFSTRVHAAERIERVLKERLGSLILRLRVTQQEARDAASQTLFEGTGAGQEMLADLMDRLSARLGTEAVQEFRCHADHRPEQASRPLTARSPKSNTSAAAHSRRTSPPRPLWLIDPPEALREVSGRPYCAGPLRLLTGPERIESGWWDSGGRAGSHTESNAVSQAADARRDYFVALDSRQRWLWIFRDPRPPGGWFLLGVFS